MISKKGSVMIWVLVVLFTLSLLLVTYAKVVHNDYRISLSINRQYQSLQNAFAGLSIARDYYKSFPQDLYNSSINLSNNETEELYPIGVLFSKASLLNEYSVNQVYLQKDIEGNLYIYTIAKHSNAQSKIRLEITDVSSVSFGSIEEIN